MENNLFQKESYNVDQTLSSKIIIHFGNTERQNYQMFILKIPNNPKFQLQKNKKLLIWFCQK